MPTRPTRAQDTCHYANTLKLEYFHPGILNPNRWRCCNAILTVLECGDGGHSSSMLLSRSSVLDSYWSAFAWSSLAEIPWNMYIAICTGAASIIPAERVGTRSTWGGGVGALGSRSWRH